MTKKQFLERCEVIYESNAFNTLDIARDYFEAMFRMKGGQIDILAGLLIRDYKRCPESLTNDDQATIAKNLLSRLTHPCQKCATKTKDFRGDIACFCED
jgi:hypothetical protein